MVINLKKLLQVQVDFHKSYLTISNLSGNSVLSNHRLGETIIHYL